MVRYLRLDWAMKRLLRDKANFEILEGFLSELLKFDVKIEEILESESNQEHAFDKYNRVDLLARNDRGELLMIEVQTQTQYDFLQRMLYGTSKLVVEHLRLGEVYGKLQKIYSIAIVYFDLGKGDDYIYHGSTRFVGMHKSDELKIEADDRNFLKVEAPQQLFPEYFIIKVPMFHDKIQDTLDEWIFFLKNEDIRPEFKAKGLEEAKRKLELMQLPVEEQRRYKRYLESLSDEASYVRTYYEIPFEDGFKEGHEKGVQEGMARMVRQALLERIALLSRVRKQPFDPAWNQAGDKELKEIAQALEEGLDQA